MAIPLSAIRKYTPEIIALSTVAVILGAFWSIIDTYQPSHLLNFENINECNVTVFNATLGLNDTNALNATNGFNETKATTAPNGEASTVLDDMVELIATAAPIVEPAVIDLGKNLTNNTNTNNTNTNNTNTNNTILTIVKNCDYLIPAQHAIKWAHTGWLKRFFLPFLKTFSKALCTFSFFNAYLFACLSDPFLAAAIPAIFILWNAERIVDYCGHVNVLIGAFALYVIRFAGLSVMDAPWYALLTHSLESVTLALVVVTLVLYMRHLVPRRLIGSGQAVPVICTLCLGNAIGTMIIPYYGRGFRYRFWKYC